MQFRLKIYLFFVVVASIALISAFSVMIKKGRQIAFDDIQTSAIIVASTTASLIDGDLVAQIKTAADEKNPIYLELQQFLRKSRNANRNKNVYIKFLYTIYPDPKNPQQFLFGVDAEETEKDLSHAGTEDAGANRDLLFNHLHKLYSPTTLQKDAWGTWLTGYAPIFNSKGEYVATVGADIKASFVYFVMSRIYWIALIISTFSFSLVFLVSYFLAQRASFALAILTRAVQEIDQNRFSGQMNIRTKDEFHDLGELLKGMHRGLTEKEKMKSGFASYVSKHVMAQIMMQGAPPVVGERKKITLCFCDIPNFTALAAKYSAKSVLSSLNEYFKVVLDTVFKYDGMIDKSLGDEVITKFGLPIDDPEQERHAVLASLEIVQALALLSAQWRKEKQPEIEMSIGIHTGQAVVGGVGTQERMEFTAVGNIVHIAACLERAAQEHQEKIVVSEETLKGLKNEFPSKLLGPLTIEGEAAPLKTYAILPLK